MAFSPADAERFDGLLETDLQRDARLGKVRRYLSGEHDLPYMPKGAKAEYEHLARRAVTNWTPLLADTYAKGLFVDGYRPARASENATPWTYWQGNGLDARQSIAHRGALEYGAAYTLVLPGTVGARRMPVIRPLSPLRSAAWFRDDDDEFPEVALRRLGTAADGTGLIQLLDSTSVYTFARPKATEAAPKPGWILSKTEEHGLGVTPMVRFRDRLDGEATGIIRPILTLQDRVNEVVFSTLIALQYASFRQRWATGLAIPEDEDGKAVEPFRAAVDRLWIAEDESARFGDFAQTELSGHHSAYDSTVRTLAAIAQVSPNILTGDLVNLSADALAQMEASTQRKIGEYETIFGESWESALRLAARAAGDTAAATDLGSEVRWRDTEARSLAQTVDALGKIATMLGVPVEALWDRIPGVTDADVQRWLAMRRTDPLDDLTREITRQTAASTAAPAEEPADPIEPSPAPAVDAAQIKGQSDALGSLIRAGVVPESAAEKVGLDGLEFSGAVPVSLRLPTEEASDLEAQ